MWLHKSQHNYRQANPQAWLVQLTRSDEFYRYQFWSDYRWGALVMSFTGSNLYRLPVGHVPVKLSRNPPSVVPVISPVLILEPSPEAFPLVGLLGVPVPVCTDYRWVLFLWRNPFRGCHWSPLFDPGTSTRGLPTGGTVGVPVPVMFLWSCQGTPLQWLPVISPVLILEPPPEAFPLVWLLGVPVPVLIRPPVRLLRGFTYQKSRWPLRPLSSLCRILDRYRSCSGYR